MSHKTHAFCFNRLIYSAFINFVLFLIKMDFSLFYNLSIIAGQSLIYQIKSLERISSLILNLNQWAKTNYKSGETNNTYSKASSTLGNNSKNPAHKINNHWVLNIMHNQCKFTAFPNDKTKTHP